MSSSSPLIIACNWISRLAWINLSWMVMTLAGGVVAGVIPASVVACTMLRRYLNGAAKITAGEMAVEFKQEFVRANLSGWTVLLPTLSAAWYAKYATVNLDGIWSVMALAVVPLFLLGLVLVLATVIQMSIYQAGFREDVRNGLALIFGGKNISNKKALGLSILVFALTLLVGQFLPVVLVFYFVTPAFLTCVAVLWLEKEELTI